MDATRDDEQSEEDSTRSLGVAMAEQQVLLRQPGIWITGKWFIVGSRRYYVAQLSHLRTARGRHDPLTIRAVVTAVLVLVAIGAVMLGASVERPIRLSAVPPLGAALLLPVVLAWVGHRLRPRPYELWAEYKGATIKVFYSDSEREFGQVCRALVRAREIARLGAVGEPWASLDPWGTISR